MLLARETLQLVKLIMTDGDAQEMAQVDYAVDIFLWNLFVPDGGGITSIKAGGVNAEGWVLEGKESSSPMSGQN